MRRLLLLIGIVALLQPPTVAGAHNGGGDIVAFSGAVEVDCVLPEYPSVTGNTTTCSGIFLGQGGGVDDNGNPYVVTGTNVLTPPAVTANIDYQDECLANGTLSPRGTVNGTLTITGLSAVSTPASTTTVFTTRIHNPVASRHNNTLHFLTGPSHFQMYVTPTGTVHGSSSVGDFAGFDGVGKGDVRPVPGVPQPIPLCGAPAHGYVVRAVVKLTVN